MSKRQKTLLIIVSVVALVAVAGAVFMVQTQKSLSMLTNIPLGNIDLAAIPDGTYFGAYSAFPVAVETEVTVQDGVITAINLLKHQHGQGKAAEVLPGLVVESQSLQIDAVTGATYSSRVILLAIKDALER